MRRTILMASAAVATLALMVAGCASDVPHSPGGPSGTPTATLSAEALMPSGAPTSPPAEESPIAGPVFDPEDPNTWVIDFSGIGPFTLGGSFAAAFDRATHYSEVVDSEDLCDSPDTAPFTWVGAGDESPRMSVVRALDRDTIVEVALRDSLYFETSPITREGIRLGSSLAELHAAYRDLESFPNPYPGRFEGVPEQYFTRTNSEGVAMFFGLWVQGAETPTVTLITVTKNPGPDIAACD